MDTSEYIGSRISLTSRSLIRYEGVLLQINPMDSTITLSNGTCVAACVNVGQQRAGGSRSREELRRRRWGSRARSRRRGKIFSMTRV